MKTLLYVTIGGAAGTITRYLVGQWGNGLRATLPWGTLLANIAGSFLLGWVTAHFLHTGQDRPDVRLAITAGYCGAFTTMSTFSFETMQLLSGGDYARALVYVIGSVGGSLASVSAGFALGLRFA